VDDLKEQAQLGPSPGKESHRLDAMAHTLGDDFILWRLGRHLRGPLLTLQNPNDLPLEARALQLGD
jgi:hypothetical protein